MGYQENYGVSFLGVLTYMWLVGDFSDARWQQTYEASPLILAMCVCSEQHEPGKSAAT